MEVDFFPFCPLPYSLPSGSSGNLTARHKVPSCQPLRGQVGYEFNLYRSFMRGVLSYNKVDKCCPLTYSLPSGSSANFTARRGAPSCADRTGGTVNKSVLYFLSF